jgi:heat shock protein HtpX
MPEVGIYDSEEINAFATGPTRSRALVAVSTGLLSRMNRNELEGVLGHEVSHIANGDMVTMTLVQGVVNAFVMFLARAIAFAVATMGRGRDNEGEGFSYLTYAITVFVLEMVFMILGSLVVFWFSRQREFRADAGGARVAGQDKMIRALQALKQTFELVDTQGQPALNTLKISGGGGGLMRLFSTHPSLDERIKRLQMLP